MGVQLASSARRVVGLLEVDTQGLRNRAAAGLSSPSGPMSRDELARSTRIVCRECRDLKFPIRTERTACRVAQQQPMHAQRGLVAVAKPFDAAAGRADGCTPSGDRSTAERILDGRFAWRADPRRSVVVPAGRVRGVGSAAWASSTAVDPRAVGRDGRSPHHDRGMPAVQLVAGRRLAADGSIVRQESIGSPVRRARLRPTSSRSRWPPPARDRVSGRQNGTRATATAR